MKFDTDMLARMREATQLLQTQGPVAATAAIQRALNGVSAEDGSSSASPAPSFNGRVMHDINPPIEKSGSADSPRVSGLLYKLKRTFRKHWPGRSDGIDDVIDVEDGAVVDEPRTDGGRFITGACTNAAGTRKYKLYIPKTYRGREGDPVPLVVMLHGCKQNPDDFAAGTRMNEVAEQNNCLVVYPAQAKNANGSNCWNWFQPTDQQRERGEPSIIADIAREITRTHHVDPARVYVAGLSAGGAMAAVVGNAYPDVFAAVGIHSGLPRDAAHDIPSAFAAMKSGMPQTSGRRSAQHAMPVIVFHGDADQTVHPRNGDQALAQCVNETADRVEVKTQRGEAPGGYSYTKTVQVGPDGRTIAEKWIVHGAGHAWSGGSRKGSFTDPKGPDASKEMLRFFYSHSKQESA